MAHVYLLDYGLSLLLGPKLQGAEDSGLFTDEGIEVKSCGHSGPVRQHQNGRQIRLHT